MLKLQHIFYSLGLLSIIFIIFINSSPSFEPYPSHTQTLIDISEDIYYKNLLENKANKKGKKEKVAGSFPERRFDSSNKNAKSDENIIDNLIKNIDENDPLLKRVVYTLESQRKLKNNNGDKQKSRVEKAQKTIKSQHSKELAAVLKKQGIFKNLLQTLGAYPKVPRKYFNSQLGQKPRYELTHYEPYNDEDYCQLADLYNLDHPENMFQRMTFFTDHDKNGLSRKDVLRKIGHDLSPRVSIEGPKTTSKSGTINIDPRTTMFYVEQSTFHLYHQMGKHFLCATQMYNRIPGHGALRRKDLLVDNINSYALRYKDKKTCFNKDEFFPKTYRLYIKEECSEFLKILNSEYIQGFEYIVKSPEEHADMMDLHQASLIKEMYDDGDECGKHKDLVLIQKYIDKPLLLDFNNKLNLRIHILIASTNPLIVFSHDGLVRASLFPFSRNDRSTVLTNLAINMEIYTEVASLTRSLHGMTKTEMSNYQIWTLERLERYLLESNKIKEPGWVENYLKPKLKEAVIHLVRMSESSLWNQSNVFELFGIDFFIDEELRLWFMECNLVGEIAGRNEFQTSFLVNMLKDMFEIQYAYYRSRMKRIMTLLKELESEYSKMGSVNYGKWKNRYSEATKNRLEPEYSISKNNSFDMIMDRNLIGSEAYFGILRDECVD